MNKKDKKKLIFWQHPVTSSLLAQVLESGNFFLGSTDTILGFYAPVTKEGFNLLNELKGRQEKPYLILTNKTNGIFKNLSCENLFLIEKITKAFWPGPLTLIVQAPEGTADYMTSTSGTIALRMPRHKGIEALLEKVPMIFSTSLNRAGQEPPKLLEDVLPDFMSKAAYWVMDDVTCSGLLTVPSTIIEIKEGRVSLVREGAISWCEVQRVVNS